MVSDDPHMRPRRPKLQLPFDNRREDAGEWAYDHRVGLCVTLIAYLLLAIAFVSSKIIVGSTRHAQGFYIDLQEMEQLVEVKERLEEEVTSLFEPDMNVKVIAGEKRQYDAWTGGSILAGLAAFPQLVVAHEEYNEVGPGIVHRHCIQ